MDSKTTSLSESEAITLIQNKVPDLQAYPSDQLPPKSIKTEKADSGWYVAFVQEGSGVPILAAECYFVDGGGGVTKSGTYKPKEGDGAGGETFSAKTCSLGTGAQAQHK